MAEHEQTPREGSLWVESQAAPRPSPGALRSERQPGGNGASEAASSSSPTPKALEAKDVLEGIVERMGLQVTVTIREDDERIVLDVQGKDAGRAIGKKGQTLDALQFLVNKIVNRFPDGRRHVLLDSGDYRDRHDRSLQALAKREARRAKREGRVVTLDPMNARDRRVVHLTLAKFSGVTTQSEGQGEQRRIRIIPTRVPRRQHRR